MGGTEWALLVLLSFLWGGAFFLSKIAVAEVPPLLLVFLRASLAAATLVVILTIMGQRLPGDWRTWRALLVMGLFNNAIPFALLFWGQTHIPSGLAAILNATTPLWSVVIAQLAGGQERLTTQRVFGVLLGLIGVAVMLAPGFAARVGGDTLAECACLIAALSYGIAGVFGRRFLRGLAPLATAAGQLVASSAIMLPVVLLAVPDIWTIRPDSGVAMAVLGLALLGTALAYVIYFRVLATAGATNILLVTLLIPVSAALLGGLFLNEKLEARHLIGMAVIALGLAAIDGRPFMLLRRTFAR
jgi:drug/metabolite transporter (DMT)-like permease